MAYFDQRQTDNEEYRPVFRDPRQNVPQEEARYDGEETYGDAPEAYAAEGGDNTYYADDTNEYDEYDEYEEYEAVTPEEKRARRRARWRLLAGMGDFFGVVTGAVVILLLIALLVSLISWVQADISQFFTLWQKKL